MSVAVLSADAVIARMLLLEAKRCGYYEEDPMYARVLLVDLDHPIGMCKGGSDTLCIGFSATPERVDKQTREGLFALLSLPFSVKELSALLAHGAHTARAALLRDGETLWLSGKKLHFSKTEQALLSMLYENRHRTVTIAELHAILGENAEHSNAVAVYLYRLRRKLESDGRARIITVRGVGYRWMGEERV